MVAQWRAFVGAWPDPEVLAVRRSALATRKPRVFRRGASAEQAGFAEHCGPRRAPVWHCLPAHYIMMVSTDMPKAFGGDLDSTGRKEAWAAG